VAAGHATQAHPALHLYPCPALLASTNQLIRGKRKCQHTAAPFVNCKASCGLLAISHQTCLGNSICMYKYLYLSIRRTDASLPPSPPSCPQSALILTSHDIYIKNVNSFSIHFGKGIRGQIANSSTGEGLSFLISLPSCCVPINWLRSNLTSAPHDPATPDQSRAYSSTTPLLHCLLLVDVVSCIATPFTT
jgi:hypothetical protein